MQQPAQYLFVYGTLMSAFTNPTAKCLQQSATFVAKATAFGRLYDAGSYPAFIALPNCPQQVFGELWALPSNSQPLLKLLDEYEGSTACSKPPYLYLRQQIPVYLNIQSPAIPAWTYVYNRSIKKMLCIDSGNYLLYLANKNASSNFTGFEN